MLVHTVSMSGLDLKVPAETLEDAQLLVQLALQWLVPGETLEDAQQLIDLTSKCPPRTSWQRLLEDDD
jgi:hypothetical protein